MSGPGEDSFLDQAAVRAVFGAGYPVVAALAGLLEDEGVVRGLIGPREAGRLWTRHLINCAALEPFLPRRGLVVDIGSGAGLPGLVLAAMRPDLDFELVDAMRRRTQWLEEAVEGLGLANAVVTWSRVEALHGQRRCAAVVSRAVGSLAVLAEWGAPLLEPGGLFLALKGRSASDELRRYQAAGAGHDLTGLQVKAVRVLAPLEATYVVRGTKGQTNVGAVAHN